MTDPEIEYARLVSGDAAAVRARAEDLLAGTRDLLGVRTDLADAQDVPVWSGAAATAFVGRAAGLRHGLSLTRVALERARGALEAAATAYDTAVDHAAVGTVVTLLESSATDYSRTDDVVGSHFRGLTPPQ